MASSSISLSLQSPDDITEPVAELYAAVQEGDLTKIKTILDLGIDVASQCGLLHTAASSGRVNAARLPL